MYLTHSKSYLATFLAKFVISSKTKPEGEPVAFGDSAIVVVVEQEAVADGDGSDNDTQCDGGLGSSTSRKE